MANITIGGGGASVFKDAIPSALQFTSWDNYQWFQQGGQGFNINYQNFNYNPAYFNHVFDVANKKFFAIPQGMGNKYDYKYDKQSPIGIYKYDHQTDASAWIEFNKTDVYNNRTRFNNSQNNNYDNIVYDETSNRLFWLCYSDKTLWEIDQSTGAITQKTTCTLAGSIASVVACAGILYVLDTSKNFAKYTIASNTWTALTTQTGSAAVSQGYARLLTDGSAWIIFVPYQNMASAGTELMKYSIAGNTWAAAATASAPTSTSSIVAEVFNGFVYVQYLGAGDNFSSIWKYNITGNTWTASAFNLRTKGLTSGGAYGMFRANSKLYWIGSYQVNDYSATRAMQRYGIWEMDTAEVFTLNANKFMPVQIGQWCYNQQGGYEQDLMAMSKSNARYQIYNGFHSYARGYRYIPYIDPILKTVEWVKVPMESGKEKEWTGWGAVVKSGKLYMIDPVSLDLFVCTIGTWTWTKKDNIYTRLGTKMPYSVHGDEWYYGCGLAYLSGCTPHQLVGGLFAVKEDATNIYLMAPRYGSSEYVYVYKFDVVANQWVVLSTTSSMPNSYLGNNTSQSSYAMWKNHLITSNEASSWMLLVAQNYVSTTQTYVQRYYAFNPTDGSFEATAGYNNNSQWYGVYGFTLEGKPVWYAGTGDNKLYYNDMATMAYDVTNKLLEQFLNDQNKYIWINQGFCQYAAAVFNINPDNFEQSFMLRIASSSTQGAVNQLWGFYQQISAAKGGYLLGWSRSASLSSPYRYGRIMIDNDGVRSVIVNDALPSSVVDSATVFTTKVKKNFKLYLEYWCYNNGLVTFFAPTN
jgi:hypothetical protein